MSCKEMKIGQSDCSEGSLPKITGLYITKDGVRVYKKSNGDIFTYQNDAEGLKALAMIQKYEFWQATFKPKEYKRNNHNRNSLGDG